MQVKTSGWHVLCKYCGRQLKFLNATEIVDEYGRKIYICRDCLRKTVNLANIKSVAMTRR